nr:hypothetical protein [Deltaproteobacteria bacterium]
MGVVLGGAYVRRTFGAFLPAATALGVAACAVGAAAVGVGAVAGKVGTCWAPRSSRWSTGLLVVTGELRAAEIARIRRVLLRR